VTLLAIALLEGLPKIEDSVQLRIAVAASAECYLTTC
jgi:hypothetical protein